MSTTIKTNHIVDWLIPDSNQPSKESGAGDYLGSWKMVRIGELATIGTGSRNTEDRQPDGIYPFFVRSQNVERINSYSFEGPAVLTAGDGVGTGKVFHYAEGKFDCHQRVYCIRSFDRRLNPKFFFYYFSTHFYARISAMTAKSSVDSVRMDMISEMRVPLPSGPEQLAIANAVSDVDELILRLGQLIVKKRSIQMGAAQQLLSGRIRLKDFVKEWATKSIRDVVSEGPTNGYSGPSNEDGAGTLTLRLNATTSGRLVLNDDSVKRLSTTIAPNSDLFLRPNDVLVQRSNTVDRVGTAAVFDGPPQTYIYPDLMMRLRFRDEKIARWVWRYLNSYAAKRFFAGIAAGSTGSMPKISGGALSKMLLSVPSPREQAAIVSLLDEMDADIAALEKRREKTTAVKLGMMQALLTGRVRLVRPEVDA